MGKKRKRTTKRAARKKASVKDLPVNKATALKGGKVNMQDIH
jgi:hypothetical protein